MRPGYRCATSDATILSMTMVWDVVVGVAQVERGCGTMMGRHEQRIRSGEGNMCDRCNRTSETAIAANKVVEAVAAVAEPAVIGEAAAAEAATVGITEVRVSEVVERRSGSNESKCSGCGGRMQCKWRSKVSVDRELSSQCVMGRRRQRLARCCCVQTATNESQPTTEETAANRI